MTDEFGALLETPRATLGAEDRAARRAARAAEAERRATVNTVARGQGKLRSADFLEPVTATFLSEVFRMKPETVKRRLARCPKMGVGERGVNVYDFKEACAHLLKPKMDVATYIKTLNASDMPPIINKVFWEAQRVKNKVMLETGEAWRTEDVLDTFGDVFMQIKDRMPLFTEEMRELGLNDEQSKKLQEMVDQFQKDLHESLVEMPKRRQTRSRGAEMDQIVGELADDEVDDIEDDSE